MAADLAGSIDHYRQSARRQSRTSVVLALLLSLAAGALVLAFPPGWIAVLLCAGVAFVIATWHRPVVGIAVVLGITLLFEQFDFALFTPITRRVPFFDNASRFTGLKGLEASPLEFLLVIIVLIVLLQATLRRWPIRENPLALPAVLFSVALALWLVFGMVSGGQLTIAFWELRGLAYFCLLVFVVPQTVLAMNDVRMLLWVAIAVVSVKAAQGIWNYAVILRGDIGAVRSITSHEDALFIAWMVVFAVGLMLYRTAPAQRWTLLIASPLMAMTFILTDRRAAYVALAIGLVVLVSLVATDSSKRILLLKAGIPVLLVFAFVVAAGWNSSGPLGLPAQAIKSIAAPESKEDADSSYYRRAEEVNLIHAIEDNSMVGLGFGRPFQTPGQGGIVNIGFSLADVIPHNEVMWIWAKMGTVGFGLFWVMIGSIIAFGGVVFRATREPYAKVVAALVTSAVTMQIVVSYVDLQLTYARNMVFLGVLVGILSCLPRLLQTKPGAPPSVTPPARAHRAAPGGSAA
jgi:hypothetical protein